MNVTKLREEFSTLKTATDEFVGLPEDADITQEQLDQNATRIERMTFIKAQIDQHAKFAQMKLDNPADPAAPGVITTPTDPSGRDEFTNISVADETPEQAALRFSRETAAINRWIRYGDPRGVKFAVSGGEQFTTNSALTTASGSNALLPVTVATPVVIKRILNPLRAAIQARGLKVMTTDTTEPISVPVFDDTANTADAIPQNQTGDNEKEPGLSNLVLGNTLYDSGTVWASNTLLNGLTYDLLGYLQPMLDQRIDIKQATAWMLDLATNATVGVTTASTAGVTYSELLAWQHSIPLVNRPWGAFILSDGLFQTIRNLVDSQGHPIYQESLRDDAPNTLLGWPVFLTDQLAAPAATAVSGVAIAANLTFVRDITNKRIARYVNIPTYRDQFGLAEFANGDFKYAASGVRALKHHA